MKHTDIRAIQTDPAYLGQNVTVCGWVRTSRDSKNVAFLELNDGTSLKHLQIVLDKAAMPDVSAFMPLGTSLKVEGVPVASERNGVEIEAKSITVLGACPGEYPLQKKRHTLEYMRTIPHLRVRTNTFNAVDFPEVWGLPRFKERPFLYSRAFIPSPDLVAAVQRLVPQEPAEARTFFQSAGNVAALETLVAGFSPDRLGTLESEAARRSRVHEELGACAETLRRELGHPVRSLCWPWGSGSEVAREEGRKAGFSVFFTTRMGANPPAAPEAVHRFKVRDAGWSWLRLRLEIYSRPWLARLYGACRI